MIGLETFLFGLLLSSTFTGLATEACKKTLSELNITYKANVLAGIVSIVVSTFIGVGYMIPYGTGFSYNSVMCLIAYTFMNWLCAMLGYDKVIQTISQFKKPK